MSLFDTPFLQIKGVTLTSTTPGVIHIDSDLIVTNPSDICRKIDVYTTYEHLYDVEKVQRQRVLDLVNISHQNTYRISNRVLSIGSTAMFRCQVLS
jgi:hypothetical protein